MTGDPIRLARAYLMAVAEPPAPALFRLVAEHGPVRAAELVRAAEVSEHVAEETTARRERDPARDLEAAEAVGARLVIPEDPEWPAWPLHSLETAAGRGHRWAGAPLGLWVRGPLRLDELCERAVAVVGARSATAYGEHVAAEFGYGLAETETTVVSGAAYGIDAAAHRGALTGGGPTIAVLACGIDLAYPTGNTELISRIAATGAVVSEYLPGSHPARYRFLVRNRLIAALGAGTVVVEAGVRSGARNTAATAHALGKPVLAVPGPITSPMSLGCHQLVRGGAATIVCSVAEVLDAVGPIGDVLAEPPTSPRRPTDGLGPQAMRVHDALGLREGRSPDQVSADSGVPLGKVRALLPELELTGLAERGDDGWRKIDTAGARRSGKVSA